MKSLALDVLALLKPGEHCVSLVGAGGKTTLMYALAHAWAESGRTVLCTSSTHIMKPDARSSGVLAEALSEQDCKLLESLAPGWEPACARLYHSLLPLWKTPVLTLGFRAHNQKWQGFPAPVLCALAHLCPSETLLIIEADGAARYPLKIPAAHEPVVPLCTQVCIGVMGLSALGQAMQDAIFRLEKAPADWAWTPDTIIRPEHLAILASQPQGLFARCPASARQLIFCNQADATNDDSATEIFRLYTCDVKKENFACFAGSAQTGTIRQYKKRAFQC